MNNGNNYAKKGFKYIIITSIYFILYSTCSLFGMWRRYSYWEYKWDAYQEVWGNLYGVELVGTIYILFAIIFVILAMLLVIIKKRELTLIVIIGLLGFIELLGILKYDVYFEYQLASAFRLIGVIIFLIILIRNVIGVPVQTNIFFKKILILPVILYVIGSIVDLLNEPTLLEFHTLLRNIEYILDIFILIAPCMWLKEYLSFNIETADTSENNIVQIKDFIEGADSLKTYADLFKAGVITQEEFNSKKDQILKRY